MQAGRQGIIQQRSVTTLLLAIVISSALYAQTTPDDLKQLVGRRLMLLTYGRQSEVSLSAKKLAEPGPSCDSPVEVRKASFSRNRLTFELETIGYVQRLATSSVSWNPSCRGNANITKLTIRDVDSRELGAILTALQASVLMQPEDYLKKRGIAFNAAARDDGAAPITLPSPGVSNPRPLMTLTADYTDEARLSRISGMVFVSLVVGSDGRPRSMQITKGLGHGLDEQVLRILSLWRFSPATQIQKPVASVNTITMDFNLH